MKHKLTSLRLRMLLPVIAMTLFVVILLTMLFSRAYIGMILQQEREANAAGFDTVSRAVAPLINSCMSEVQSIMKDDRVASYARLRYGSLPDLIRARISCRGYLQAELSRHDAIFGLLFMRKDGSLFGTLPEGTFFRDDPDEAPLPKAMTARILKAPLGETVWVGPLPASAIYGFENDRTPRSVMIAAWKSVDVRYGECCAMMLLDESFFRGVFDALEDGSSSWHLLISERAEIYHTGQDGCPDPARLISESNTGTVFRDGQDRPICTFSMSMKFPNWTLVRVVYMENSERVINRVRRDVGIISGTVFLIALAIYEFWLKRFMRQFDSLKRGIIRTGEGDLEPAEFEPSSIDEFREAQREINRTRRALSEQMETIRGMKREKMELETKRKEQELILRELSTAREIQKSALPHTFPPFPERKEIDLYASMDPAQDVGGDFYDFFFIDEDHLCLVIADVSGKGIPAALFMMAAKRILEDSARLEHSASEILEKTNESICDSNQADMFVTVWLGILEISTGRLTAANAGHEYPAIRRAGGSFELYRDGHGFVIGGMKGASYREYGIRLEPGDKLFVYTDGVPEATGGSGEMFGPERMVAALNTCGEGSPEEILRGVRRSVDAFVGDAEQFDDLTMLCLEYRGPGNGSGGVTHRGTTGVDRGGPEDGKHADDT